MKFFTKEWYSMMQNWDNHELVEKVMEDYGKYIKEASKSLKKNIVENLDFHDCKIVGLKQNEHCLTILLDNSGGYSEINEVRFENYEVIKQDSLLQESWWLYEEIYEKDSRYEIHVLLHDKFMELAELIISAENISFNT